PFLDLGRRKIELPTRLRNRGLALDDLQHQRRLAPRRPTLDFFFHHHAHGCLLRKVTPEQEITGSLHGRHAGSAVPCCETPPDRGRSPGSPCPDGPSLSLPLLPPGSTSRRPPKDRHPRPGGSVLHRRGWVSFTSAVTSSNTSPYSPLARRHPALGGLRSLPRQMRLLAPTGGSCDARR